MPIVACILGIILSKIVGSMGYGFSNWQFWAIGIIAACLFLCGVIIGYQNQD